MRPYFVCDRKRPSMSSFQSTCDELASKIRVPFDLLMVSSKNYSAESRIRLNIYCSELLTHYVSLNSQLHRLDGSGLVPKYQAGLQMLICKTRIIQ